MNSAHCQDGISPLITDVPSTLWWKEEPVATAGDSSPTATELLLATDPKLPFLSTLHRWLAPQTNFYCFLQTVHSMSFLPQY